LETVLVFGVRGPLERITCMVDKCAGCETVGHVYLALGRLAELGLITVHSGRSRSYGEEPQRRFEITEYGDRALRRAKLEGKELVTAREGLQNGCTERSGS